MRRSPSQPPPSPRSAVRPPAPRDATGRAPAEATRAAPSPKARGRRPVAQQAPAPRPEPLQAILRAAGELLDERGVDGLNTTDVARRAGISTATLYRHFPDKHAVLRALVLDIHEERAAAVVGTYEAIAAGPDWREPLARAIRVAYRMRLSRPGGRSTRRALQTSPELWQWDQRQNEELARALAKAMRRRRPDLPRAVSERIALVTVTASVALLDLACLDPRRGKAILEDATALREAYLARYLD